MQTLTLSLARFLSSRKTANVLLPIFVCIGLGSTAGTTGCTAAQADKFLASIPSIEAGLQDAGLVLSQILTIASSLAQANPSLASGLAKLQTAVANAQQALDVLVRLSTTATDLQSANYTSAVSDFSAAFAAVIALAQQIGIEVSGAPTSTTPAPAVAPRATVRMPLLLQSRTAK